MRGIAFCALAGLAVLPSAAPAGAQNISPMVYDLGTSGPEARREVEFWNSQNRPVAIEVMVSRRAYDLDGNSVDRAAPADFEIVPAQFLAPPGGRQKVRIRYKGAPGLPKSATYAISFRQVPVGGKADNSVRFLLDFTTLAHVVPAGAAPDVRAEAVAFDAQSAVVTFVNRGSRYGRIDDLGLRIFGAGQPIDLNPTTLRDAYNLRWILPGERRRVSFPLEQVQLADKVRVERVPVAER